MFYYLIAFISSMSIMILEMAGIRILPPFLGGTYIVTTSSIGIMMASLALGYLLGGKYSNKNPSFAKLALILFISGIYILILSFCQFIILRTSFILNISLFIKSIIYSCIIFTIPSILLGAVSPYVIQLMINNTVTNENTGNIVGKFYAISTIGAILGTFLCGFVLIIFFGIDRIFFFLSIILFLCSIACSIFHKKITKKINRVTE